MLDNIEKIGKVNLNLTDYDGVDQYSDGDSEDRILEIVKNQPVGSGYQRQIYESASWPVLYHLSEEREYLLNWFPFRDSANVLEIGAGCGAITGCLCRKAKTVKAVELSKKRSLINAYRNREKKNLEILVGNFKKIYPKLLHQFDYVTLIGVLEYAAQYMDGEDGYLSLLHCVDQCLNENGKIILAIENRMGLKYFAGCLEDHLGIPFVGIEGYHDRRDKVQTFNKPEIEKLLREAGFTNWKFYYPYPDYKFPHTIYSDECLPKKGDLIDNVRNLDANRLVVFDETLAYNMIISSGRYPEFANSFLLVIDRS